MDIKEIETIFTKHNIDAKGKAIFKKLFDPNSDLL